jgi:hypothetical protein
VFSDRLSISVDRVKQHALGFPLVLDDAARHARVVVASSAIG